jgi:hypothetical protein
MRMSPDSLRPEDLFLHWLFALPEGADPVSAAASRLSELARESPAEERFCALLRQATAFSPTPNPRRRGRVGTSPRRLSSPAPLM